MRDLSGWLKPAILFWLAAASGIHLYFGGFGFPEPINMRGFHLLVFDAAAVPAVSRLRPLADARGPACPTGSGPLPPPCRMPG